MSWSPELRYFTSIEQYPGKCDLIINVPTVIMKIDACKYIVVFVHNYVNNICFLFSFY